ncbi:MAG: aminotransferase class V-fold PLP-dependent enzyme [Candidatus Moranbacteria bacterium]|nr:aminotransferase class V-fold PLP-dependent enzyme [Candidatus Moranbacteria bacterium]MBP6034056.1 aminotransferase class V-fold PLP-dependent enzyme [Candidatus Moranbacteria bacterium]MBP7696113.1 aminotransferase class V-fold PLP-dependent enzyme [Candidatus Moranbacteria bacterium]
MNRVLPADIREYFPIFSHHPELAYLDSAATSLKPDCVITAERAYEEEYSANIGRGLYPIAEQATEAFEAVRERTARFIGATPREIIFTQNTTQALNMVATWIAPRLRAGDNIVITDAEHHANFLPWVELAEAKDIELRIVPFDADGLIEPVAMATLVDARTVLVAFSAVSNVFGGINPVTDIIQAVRAKNRDTLTVIDAAQAALHIPIDVAEWNADFVAFSAHKLYGPTGVGILYGRASLLETLPPLTFGGGMVLDACPPSENGRACSAPRKYKDIPYRFEAGTPNISGVIGWGAALDFLETIGVEAIRAHEASLIRSALTRLTETFGDAIRILGPSSPERRSGLIAFALKGIHPHDLAHLLGEQSICIRAGEHCASPLHRRLDITSTARISFGIYTTEGDIDRFIEAAKKALTLLA